MPFLRKDTQILGESGLAPSKWESTQFPEEPLRAVQSEVFEVADKSRTLRHVLATLQDLGFVVDEVEGEMGIVSATKLDGYVMRLTVTVRPRGDKHMVVRASGEFNNQAVSDAEPYAIFLMH